MRVQAPRVGVIGAILETVHNPEVICFYFYGLTRSVLSETYINVVIIREGPKRITKFPCPSV